MKRLLRSDPALAMSPLDWRSISSRHYITNITQMSTAVPWKLQITANTIITTTDLIHGSHPVIN